MSLSLPSTSALTAGILVILQMLLMLAVVLTRMRNRQSLGDGGNSAVIAAVARHGNFSENAAIFIIGFALLELLGGGGRMLTAMCTAFVVARISHIIGLSLPSTLNLFRTAGVGVTAAVGFTLGTSLLRASLTFLGV